MDGWTRLGAAWRLHGAAASLKAGASAGTTTTHSAPACTITAVLTGAGFSTPNAGSPQFEAAAGQWRPLDRNGCSRDENLPNANAGLAQRHGALPELVHGELWGAAMLRCWPQGASGARPGSLSACGACLRSAVSRGVGKVDLRWARLCRRVPGPSSTL